MGHEDTRSTFRCATTSAWVGMVLAVALAMVLSASLALTASADDVRVDDDEPGFEASFLAIRSAHFSNGSKRLQLRAVHPGLQREHVDRYAFSVYADRSEEIYNRRTFQLVWQNQEDPSYDKGLHLYRSEPGMEFPQRIHCRGIAMKKVEGADEAGDKPGRVVASIPQRCVKATRSVRFHYEVWNFGGVVVDRAPGRPGGSHKQTAWVRRG